MADYNDPIDWREERRRRRDEWRRLREQMRDRARRGADDLRSDMRQTADEVRDDLRNSANDWKDDVRKSKGEGIWVSHGPGNVAGVVLLCVGAWFLLSNLGIINPRDVGNFWPVILIAIGISQLIFWRGGFPPVPGIVLTAIGGVFLLRNLGLLPYNMWAYIWPVVLIAIGATLLVRALDVGASGGVTATRLHEWVAFGGVRRKIESQEFEGGDATAIFGGVRVDLRKASTNRGEVTINALALFGGVDLFVGDNWNVVVRGSGIFGGYTDRTIDRPPVDTPTDGTPAAPLYPAPTARPTLIITGFAIFGGVTVRN